jgi:hypothetical protein
VVFLVAPAAAHDCKCRSGGNSYKQGQVICILGKLARCGMHLNNSSWTFIAEACPQVRSLPSPQRPALSTKLAEWHIAGR